MPNALSLCVLLLLFVFTWLILLIYHPVLLGEQ